MKAEKLKLIGQLSELEKRDFYQFFERNLPRCRKAWPQKTFIEPQVALEGLEKTPENERRQYLWYLHSILDVVDLRNEYIKNLAKILDQETLPEKELHKLGCDMNLYLQAAQKALNSSKKFAPK